MVVLCHISLLWIATVSNFGVPIQRLRWVQTTMRSTSTRRRAKIGSRSMSWMSTADESQVQSFISVWRSHVTMGPVWQHVAKCEASFECHRFTKVCENFPLASIIMIDSTSLHHQGSYAQSCRYCFRRDLIIVLEAELCVAAELHCVILSTILNI